MTTARLGNFHPEQVALIRNRDRINVLARVHRFNPKGVGALVLIDGDDCYEMWYTKTLQPRPTSEIYYLKAIRASTIQ